MNLIDSIYYSFTKNKRDKKNIFYIIIISISVVILLGTLTYNVIHFNKINTNIEKNIVFRSLVVSPLAEDLIDHYLDDNYDYGFDKILKINNVVDMYKMSYSYIEVESDLKTDNYNGILSLNYGTKSTIPKVIIGQTISENDTGVAICAKNFYPELSINKDNPKNFISGEKILNNSFTISQNIFEYRNGGVVKGDKIYTKTFKVVGLYDNNDAMLEPNNCFVSSRDMINLIDGIKENILDNTDQSRIVIVDNKDNLNDAKKSIENLGFDVHVQAYLDDELLNNLKTIILIIVGITIVSIILISIFYLRKHIINNLKNIGILHSIGYTKKEINDIYFNQVLELILLSFGIGIISFEFILIIIKLLFKNYILYNNYIIVHNIGVYAFTFLIITVIPVFINNIHMKKTLKRNTIDLLKGSNE